jgi:dTDP-4-dehydrorhamnose reductase
MKILVLGSNGQLAMHLRELWPDATFWGRAEADLSAPAAIEARIRDFQPEAIVNAAAYTAVDKAETEPDLAWRLNAEAPAAMARAAAALDVPLVQVSTDYVFDGTKVEPYVETDPVAPLNVYGRTKLGGELAVATLCRRHWILRTSWVFSEHGHNFVKTMLRLARERDRLSVVADQIGRPTYAGDLAAVIGKLLLARPGAVPYGLHHVGGGTPTTWHAFATAIFAAAFKRGLIARSPEVARIPTSAYPTPARRPLSSVLKPSARLERAYPGLVDWQSSLGRCLDTLQLQGS